MPWLAMAITRLVETCNIARLIYFLLFMASVFFSYDSKHSYAALSYKMSWLNMSKKMVSSSG